MRDGVSSKHKVMNLNFKFISRLGLQYQFILLATSAIIIIMSTIGYLAVERERSIMYTEAERSGRLLGETLAIPIINDFIYERLGLVEEGGLLDNYISEIFKRQDIHLLYLAVLDSDGKVISHNNITELGKLYSDPLTQKVLVAHNTVVQKYAGPEHSVLDFGVPLRIGHKRWGTLKFGISLEKEEHETAATMQRIMILTVIFLIPVFVIVLLLSKRFLSPITKLAATMDKTSGDYLDVKVKVKGHDELAVLGERFNSMIERIKHANDELKKTHEKLIQSEKLASIGILASGVAHEINNPLGGLFNCLQMLKKNPDNMEFRERYLDLMKEGLDRIETTVSKLLWMSKKHERTPVVVNIKNAVESVYSFVEYKIKAGKIVLANEVPGDLHLVIDVHDFQQMLVNLFINAINAMKDGGRLSVRGYKEESSVKIEVKDTGHGIAKENMGRIFDPFFTTSATGEGTGLGLWLTYEIVKNYNGEISVESETGKGSTFILSFPDYLPK